MSSGLDSTQSALIRPGWRSRYRSETIAPVELGSPWENRVLSVAVFIPTSALMGLARWLTPSSSGMETHLQLGLSPCGFYKATGLPCPSCGMTTAFSNVAHAHFIDAMHAQVAGTFLAFTIGALLLISCYCLVSGLPIGRVFERFFRPQTFVFGGLLIIGAWFLKIALVTQGI